MAAGGRRPHLSAHLFLSIAAIGCCLALAACGGSSKEPTSEAARRQELEQKSVKFAKCLREHGVHAETGTGPNGRGFSLKVNVGGAHPGGPGGESAKSGGPPPEVQRAMNACKQYRPAPKQLNLSPAEKAEQAKKALEFARCMRSHGVNVPDPGPSGALELNDIDPQSATFETAQKDCQHLMGKSPLAIRARSGGPGGPSSRSEGVRSPAPAGGGEK
jgi:hypothetical protein